MKDEIKELVKKLSDNFMLNSAELIKSHVDSITVEESVNLIISSHFSSMVGLLQLIAENEKSCEHSVNNLIEVIKELVKNIDPTFTEGSDK